MSAVEGTNPHVAFTLIRSYLELVALTYTIGVEPDYLERLSKPAPELPAGKRPFPVRGLIARAAKDMPGIARVYYSLSGQAAHFGFTAMVMAFSVEGERRIHGSTAPHWKDPDDARAAVAMLLENDDAMLCLLGQWNDQVIAPHVAYWAEHPEA